MKKYIIVAGARGVVVLLLMTLTGFAQENKLPKEQKLFSGINLGFNYTKFHSDTIDFTYGTRPAIGGFVNFKIYKGLYLKGSILYSIKGSTSISPYFKVINTYLDFNIVPQFRLCDGLYIQSGISYSDCLFSKKITLNDGKTLYKKADAELNGIVGIEFRLQKNVNIAFNYFIPLSNNKTTNFQVTLNFSLYNKGPKEHSVKYKKRHNAEEQINDFKNGTLLVRLKTSKPKIDALIKRGELEKANKAKQEQETENKKIVVAFRNKFNFCKVAFFNSNNSNNVRTRKFDTIFLNDSLEIDKSITIDTTKSVFIAEFSAIEQDTSKYISNYSYEPDGNWSVKRVEYYYGGPDFGFDALIIRDKNFVQLSKPFPYYTRAITLKELKNHPEEVLFLAPILPFQNWSYNQTVENMNQKLINYYKRNR